MQTEAKAIELFVQDGTPAGVWYCPKCKRVGGDLGQVEQCCEPRICECGAECERSWTSCQDCRDKRSRERRDATWNAAELIPLGAAEHLLCPEDGERLVDHDEAIRMAEEDGVTRFYDTKPTELRLNAGDILEHAVEEWYEDAYTQMVYHGAVKSLQAVLDAWHEEHPHRCWFEDNARKVDLSFDIEEASND